MLKDIYNKPDRILLNMKKRPTLKGKLLGIEVREIIDENGQVYEVNLYNNRAQMYILDNLYEML